MLIAKQLKKMKIVMKMMYTNVGIEFSVPLDAVSAAMK